MQQSSLSLEQQVIRFQRWMSEKAIPLWSTKGIDLATGAVHERLLANGEVDFKCPKRVRVQARQMFSFTVAEGQGWSGSNHRLVSDIWRFARIHGHHPSQPHTYVHLLDEQDKVADDKQDLYDTAFHLLAAGTRYRQYRQPMDLEHANQLLQHIEKDFAADNGGWTEGNYDAPCRRQNPHMHLFEAFMTLYEATNDGKWLAKAGQIFSLFEKVFYDPTEEVLLEFFDEDWNPVEIDGHRIIEPGHMFEWVWLLDWYSKLTGTPVKHFCEKLYQSGLRTGLDETSGLIYDATSDKGEPVHPTKRMWPMTELLKANLVLAQWQPQVYEEKAAHALELLFQYYIDPATEGAYIDQLDANNEVLSDVAPASTLYHLVVALVESSNYLARKGMAATA